uniref:Protein THYLAKOID ASSEMBLY 8, chloroplastic n=1 Tax=Heterorhabditis bacteriophora TaxID=37862 RepID=A0A1I7XMB3_HETBA
MLFSESSYGSHFPSLRIFPISCNRLETVALPTPSCSASSSWVYDGFSSTNDFKALVFNVSGVPERCRSLTSKSPALRSRKEYLQILDITAVRKQLSSRVRKAGNEDSLVGYCEILALAAHLDEENWKDFRGECIKELWQFVDSVCPKVPSTTTKGRAAAWKALGGFGFDAVQEKMGIPINDLVPRIITMGDIERSGEL